MCRHVGTDFEVFILHFLFTLLYSFASIKLIDSTSQPEFFYILFL